MKNIFSTVLLAVSLTLSLTACGTSHAVTKQTTQAKSGQIVLKVTKDEVGKSLMSVLKSNYKIVEKKGFVNSINNMNPDPKKKEYIAIYVSGKMATVGANQLILKKGDVITFKIKTW